MSGPTFTPGPWTLRNGQFISGAAGQIIAGVVPWNVTADEGARNAWLLAAAPDLYEALVDLAATAEVILDVALDHRLDEGIHAKALTASIVTARVAIAKAGS